MTNEILKAGDVELDYILSKLDEGLHLPYPRIMNLIKSQQEQLENTKKALDFMSECQKNWSNQCVKKQSRIELLESAIRDAAEYHRGYVEKLKESDPDRSARQQDRVNYFMDILEQAK